MKLKKIGLQFAVMSELILGSCMQTVDWNLSKGHTPMALNVSEKCYLWTLVLETTRES